MKKLFLWMVMGGIFISTFAQQDSTREKRYYSIATSAQHPPVVDGILTDAIWQSAEWQQDFVQHFPHSGRTSSFDTRFAICHDNENLYVAIHALDPDPDSIVSRLTRRDEIDGDMVFIDFDSYHDLRTCFAFLVSAGGVRADFIISENGDNEDGTWDPVWWVKTSVNDEGWAAEMKIPFSQLRFDTSTDGVWGLNVGRHIFRRDELSFWQHIPSDAPGIVHLFGELHGMGGIKPRKQAEIVPYFTSGIKTYEPDEENPFLTGRNRILNAGVDAKIGVTNNLTLDLSVNPDFGQVEADPSEVNLTAYESFFEEKRPLFIEGKNIYNFPLRFGTNMQNLFYSRRIGRSPHYHPEPGPGEFINQPEQTNILAAAKLSGKTKKGTSIGFLESVTAEEFAIIDLNGDRRKVSVEPMTNYFVGRVVQDMNSGNTILGGTVTSTYRDIRDKHLEFLPKSAITGGLDFQQYFGEREYNIKLTNYFSHITGTEESITRLQESPAHLFQRPDADYITLDTTRRSLSGYGGNLEIWKTGGRFNTLQAFIWKSPGLDVNDLGFFRMGDELMMVNWFGYNWYEPFSVFRRLRINADYFHAWDFGGFKAVNGIEAGLHAQFMNYWRASIHMNINGEVRYNSLLRGGPSIKTPGEFMAMVALESDERNKLVLEPGIRINRGLEESKNSFSLSIETRYRPFNSLNIEIEPQFIKDFELLQYTDCQSIGNEKRYIFASIDQTLVSMSLRVNLTLIPDLTVQYWGQPFLASGNYHSFKYITDGLSEAFSDRYHVYDTEEIHYSSIDDEYLISEQGTGLPEYTFRNPDFNVREFLSNLVVRYEYRPGSVIYLVWSQTRDGFSNESNFRFSRDINGLRTDDPTNIFLLKLSYRLGR